MVLKTPRAPRATLIQDLVETSMSKEKGDEGSTGSEDEIIGYRQQPGKLPFSRPGSGGKNRFSESVSYTHLTLPTILLV